MNEVFTKKISLPTTIGAYTILDRNGDFTVFVNARMGYEKQVEAYSHELKHIKNGDFFKVETADVIEMRTHQR